jgi:hypothetical protein
MKTGSKAVVLVPGMDICSVGTVGTVGTAGTQMFNILITTHFIYVTQQSNWTAILSSG